MKQLTARDGFQASNERRVVFGLGSCPRIEELNIQWQSGLKQSFRDLPVDRWVVLVEGRETLLDEPADNGPVDRQ